MIDATGDERDRGVEAAQTALRGGNLVVLPTDTVYGVAADAFDHDGTRRIFRAKQRATSFPLPVLIDGPKQLTGLVTAVPEAAEHLMAAYWPGPLTIVVASEPHLTWNLGEADGTVAVRMPLDEIALAVIRAVGPLAVTSANLSGRRPARTVEEAREALGDQVLVYLDGGARTEVAPSTIVDLTRRTPHILREGTIPAEQVLAVAAGDIEPHEVEPPQDDDPDEER